MNKTRTERNQRAPSGFTMLELIMVLILLGFLAFVVTMGLNTSQESVSTALNTFRANLRFAQSLAISQAYLTDADSPVIWGLSWAGNGYQLMRDGDSQSDIRLPETPDAIRKLPGTALFDGSGDLYFNYRGQPVSSSGTINTGDTTIKISAGDTTQTVTVVKNTGFVQ